ncbi:MAG: response regulator [Bdellovibrionaceae bacterium]|jgi:two-component system chemotaxis response regulator CheY|nr:response regulator [Pseudobdellovibrionaceae bacterium]
MFSPDTRFLVVDDFATMRKIVKKVLMELGYSQIEEADDGKPAWELIKSAHASGHPFGVVISDWNMPGMTGIDLLKAVKADPQLKSTPFILVTAESEQKNIIEAAKAGVSDYVVKPFNAQTLKAKLERVWQKHHAPKAA